MNTLILMGGLHSLCFAVFHMFFWRLLRWRSQLRKLSPVNNAVMQILNIQVIVVFLCHAAVCFIYPQQLLQTSLGKAALFASAVFWLIRVIDQVIFRKLILLSGGVNILLTLLFIAGTVIYAACLL